MGMLNDEYAQNTAVLFFNEQLANAIDGFTSFYIVVWEEKGSNAQGLQSRLLTDAEMAINDKTAVNLYHKHCDPNTEYLIKLSCSSRGDDIETEILIRPRIVLIGK